MADEVRPELKAAITKGAIADAVLLVTGGSLAFSTGQMAWLIAAAIVGGVVFTVLLAQAGAFTKADDR